MLYFKNEHYMYWRGKNRYGFLLSYPDKRGKYPCRLWRLPGNERPSLSNMMWYFWNYHTSNSGHGHVLTILITKLIKYGVPRIIKGVYSQILNEFPIAHRNIVYPGRHWSRLFPHAPLDPCLAPCLPFFSIHEKRDSSARPRFVFPFSNGVSCICWP